MAVIFPFFQLCLNKGGISANTAAAGPQTKKSESFSDLANSDFQQFADSG
jgi:hypothetical protein